MAYFILTKNDFNYPQMRDRQSLILHHKKAKKHRYAVNKRYFVKVKAIFASNS